MDDNGLISDFYFLRFCHKISLCCDRFRLLFNGLHESIGSVIPISMTPFTSTMMRTCGGGPQTSLAPWFFSGFYSFTKTHTPPVILSLIMLCDHFCCLSIIFMLASIHKKTESSMENENQTSTLDRDLMDALVAARDRKDSDESIVQTMFSFSCGIFQIYFGDDWVSHFNRMIDEAS